MIYRRSDLTDHLLYTLLDLRQPDRLISDNLNTHHEAVRSIGRLPDGTKELHAAGALIVAHAGNLDESRFVPNPVPLTVNGKQVAGKGEILFAYALPVSGTPPKVAAALLNEPAPELNVEPP